MLFALLAESAAAFHATARPGVCGRAGFAAMQQKGEASGMRTRPLGGSDIMVSELGLGTQRWGGTDFNSPDEEMCHAMLDVATEAGVNLVDTAEQYPIPSGRGKHAEGATEAIIGSWMAKDKLARRSKLVIASKITGGANVTPRNLQKDLEGADLIAVKKTAQGMLDSQYFLSLLQFVGQTARDRTKSLRLKCQEDRRKFYKTEEWDQYEAVIKKAPEAEDQAAQAVVKEVIDFL